MRKPVVSALFAAAVLSVVVLLVWYGSDMESDGSAGAGEVPAVEPHVVMPTKSSRPGCEEDGLCYIPDVIAAEAGQTIIWRNGDVAFHSVTSGAYGEPDGLFDSGHMDPGDTFSYAFGEAGTYRYHCTLHPWMAGVIRVG